ncbi:hypothetical protein Clacol_008693 [Clathrus columnatus]|uniref:Uncharacterized protein n=1 Tax=Clathrus columnatus TaxID=1419009 RepID=A0AAV5AIH6_9AGAM|nr:hypothetical protein Clacol_008693 [Clathrus columnatus]
MSVYAVPARRWEEDRSWLYLGLAIRIATDLNLHQPSSTAISAVANASSNTNNGNSIGNGGGDVSVNGSGSGAKLARSQNQNQYPSHASSSIPSNLTQGATSPSSLTTPTTSISLNTSVATTSSSKATEKLEKSEREFLNRKPSTIKEDFIIRNASEWYKRSPYNMSFDIQLCAYTELLRIVTRFHDEVWSGSRGVGNGVGIKGAILIDFKLKDVDFYTITMRYDDQLRSFQEQAAARFERDSKKDDPGSVYRTGLLPFMVNYSRLVMFSFGFQQAVERGLQRDDIFFQRCFDAACAVITTVVDRLAPTGYLRFAPDGHFIFVSFAAAFLLKLLRPDFSRIVNRSHKDQVLTLVRKLIRTLGSPEIAVDDKHTPKLYSRFLAGLVSRHSTRKKGDSVSKTQQNIGNENGHMQMSQGQLGQQSSIHQGHTHMHPAIDYGSPNSHYDLSSPSQIISPDGLRQPQTTGHGYIPSNSQGYAQNVQFPPVHYAGESQQAQGPSHVSTLDYYDSSSASGTTATNANNVQHQHFLSDMSIELGGSVQQTRGMEQFDDSLGTALPDHEYLASMQAINNAGWWGHVMMPGFTYPGGNNYNGGQQSQQQVQFGQMDFESDGVVPNSQYQASQSHNNMSTYPETEDYPFGFER